MSLVSASVAANLNDGDYFRISETHLSAAQDSSDVYQRAGSRRTYSVLSWIGTDYTDQTAISPQQALFTIQQFLLTDIGDCISDIVLSVSGYCVQVVGSC